MGDAAEIKWVHGDWQYGHMWDGNMWPDGGRRCSEKCESIAECLHWDFDCKDLRCHHYGKGGYVEDGDSQFGRDYMFLGHSSRWPAVEQRLRRLEQERREQAQAQRLKEKEDMAAVKLQEKKGGEL